jgi:tetratricopeptide (TPR) repeat protein
LAFVAGAGAADLGAYKAVVALPVSLGTTVEVDALAATITLQNTSKVPPTSPLCPKVEVIKGGAVLHCATRMISARIDNERAVIAEMRGPPALDGDATLPIFFYDPVLFRLGGPCPGDTSASRGECAIQRGDWATAMTELGAALSGPHRMYAALRLGDAALFLGDLSGAAEMWDRAVPPGPFSRLAGARLCELIDACTSPEISGLDYQPIDPRGLLDPAADEMTARKARILAYKGQLKDAILTMVEREGSCLGGPKLCRRLLLQHLKATTLPAPEALALGIALIGKMGTSYSVELSTLLAREAAESGAPRFAASLLISLVPTSMAAEPALLQAAEYYVEAGDLARAAALADFAKARLAPLKQTAQWEAVAARVTGRNPKQEPAP